MRKQMHLGKKSGTFLEKKIQTSGRLNYITGSTKQPFFCFCFWVLCFFPCYDPDQENATHILCHPFVLKGHQEHQTAPTASSL